MIVLNPFITPCIASFRAPNCNKGFRSQFLPFSKEAIMSEDNLLSWASSQPIWIQIFISLFLFFVGLPLIIYVVSVLFVGVSVSILTLTKAFSRESKPQHRSVTSEPDKFSDDVLHQALYRLYAERKSATEVSEYISSLTSERKSELKKDPRVVRIVYEMRNETENKDF